MKMRFFLLSLGSVLFVLLLFPKGDKEDFLGDFLKKEEKDFLLKISKQEGEEKKFQETFLTREERFLEGGRKNELEFFGKKSLEHFEKKQQAFSSETLVREEILFDSEYLELAQKSLKDLKWLLENYPKDQAYVRIFALDFIKERSKKEGSLFLSQFLHELFSRWEQNKIHPGAAEDLMELVMAWVECRGKEEVFESPEILFSTLRYEKKYKKIFSRALANLYPHVVPNAPKTREILKLLEEMG